MKLTFNKPAVELTDTLPVGNGRLGALIYGEMMREQVVLNENSMWSGSPEEADRLDATQYLPEIRRLLAEGKNYEVEQLFGEHFTCLGAGSNYAHGSTVPFGCYQLLGRLHLSYFQALSSGRQDCCCVENYRRELDIMTGTACVSFRLGGTDYQRTWVVSEKEQAIYLHLTASKPGMIHVGIGLDRDEHFMTEVLNDHSIYMHGQLPDGFGGRNGVFYACVAGARAAGGEVCTEGSRLYVRNADEALIAITARTDMQKDLLDAMAENAAALARSWEQIYTEHCQEMRSVMESMTLFLGDTEEGRKLAFYVMYSRYLLHCSSRKGGLPANLQGIWADEIQIPWNGDWHLNAQQMIYWLAEKGNLCDDHLPYLELIEKLVEPGRKTTGAYYGARGWLVHTCTNPWGFTSPLENAAWGSTTGSPAWLCHHLWEHYLYTEDKVYLRHVWPVMKEAAAFYMDMLVEDPEHEWLVTSPSSSPEKTSIIS